MLETPEGLGIVYQEERPIARVHYTLTVWQWVHVHQTGGAIIVNDGFTDAAGFLTVIEGERRQIMNWVTVANPLVLELEDGRRMQFRATDYDPTTSRYKIVRTGDWLNT